MLPLSHVLNNCLALVPTVIQILFQSSVFVVFCLLTMAGTFNSRPFVSEESGAHMNKDRYHEYGSNRTWHDCRWVCYWFSSFADGGFSVFDVAPIKPRNQKPVGLCACVRTTLEPPLFDGSRFYESPVSPLLSRLWTVSGCIKAPICIQREKT